MAEVGEMALNALTLMSRSGFEKLEKELEYLKTVRRVEVAEKLKEARSYGDLSENAEYDAAKDEQGILEARITEIQITIENAIIIEDDNISTEEVGVGSIIEVKRVGATKIEKLQIVGTNESDPLNGKISDESPIGKAALKKKVGEMFLVDAPAGALQFEVISISK
jgi:transcription elongation factor GreA